MSAYYVFYFLIIFILYALLLNINKMLQSHFIYIAHVYIKTRYVLVMIMLSTSITASTPYDSPMLQCEV